VIAAVVPSRPMRIGASILVGAWLACAAGACGRPAATARAPAEVASRTEPAAVADAAAPAPAPAPAPIDAPTTRFAVGDIVLIERHNAIYDARQAIGDSDCLPWPDGRRGEHANGRDEPDDFDLGTIVAVTTTCPGGEVALVDVDGQLAPIYATALDAVSRACRDAVVAMRQVVFPAWDACRARVPARNRGSAPADLRVTFDATGAVADVAYHGTTGWGPRAATCMIEATRRAHLDGRDCPARTVRLARSYRRSE
jgi:hypothetical protein